MAGQARNRHGEPKPTCEMETKGYRCITIPSKGWRYCPHHHVIAARRIAGEWERDLDWHQTTTITVTLPDLGKTLQDLDVHERAALAQLILWQHWELELPAAPDTPAETPTLSRSS